jgi:SH3-like domain-containing protein
MQAWAAPDPAGAVVATLGGHLPVQVTEVRGAWAHVLCSNGWTGWVDNRLLVVGA